MLFSLPVNAAELSQTEQAVSASVTAGATGYVNDDGVNLRSGAGTSYSVVTVMGYKTEFTFATELCTTASGTKSLFRTVQRDYLL